MKDSGGKIQGGGNSWMKDSVGKIQGGGNSFVWSAGGDT